jgi:L-amino acid N-acyltransferase YncA
MAAAAQERVLLRDGMTVGIRRAAAADETDLRAFLGALCLTARRFRFFTAGVDLDTAARWAAASSVSRLGLVAHDEQGALVGHAVFIRLDAKRAEVAIEVADRLHGNGLGTILIVHLAAIAEAQGISQFVAEVLPDNRAMLDVFCDGFDAHVCLRDGVDTVEFPTATWRVARERFGCAVLVAKTPQALMRNGVEAKRSLPDHLATGVERMSS